MPELGGKRTAGAIREKFALARKILDEGLLQVDAAASELLSEAEKLPQVAKQMRGEAAEMREATNELLGNSPPNDPPKTNGGA